MENRTVSLWINQSEEKSRTVSLWINQSGNVPFRRVRNRDKPARQEDDKQCYKLFLTFTRVFSELLNHDITN